MPPEEEKAIFGAPGEPTKLRKTRSNKGEMTTALPPEEEKAISFDKPDQDRTEQKPVKHDVWWPPACCPAFSEKITQREAEKRAADHRILRHSVHPGKTVADGSSADPHNLWHSVNPGIT